MPYSRSRNIALLHTSQKRVSFRPSTCFEGALFCFVSCSFCLFSSLLHSFTGAFHMLNSKVIKPSTSYFSTRWLGHKDTINTPPPRLPPKVWRSPQLLAMKVFLSPVALAWCWTPRFLQSEFVEGWGFEFEPTKFSCVRHAKSVTKQAKRRTTLLPT